MSVSLITDDCFNVISKFPNDHIDCTVTSPPYNKKLKDGTLCKKIEYDTYVDNVPEQEYQLNQIKVLNLLYDKTKKGGSCFYVHKVRHIEGGSISPFVWLCKTKWHIREEIVWNKTSGPEISGFRFTQIDERIYWMVKGAYHPRLDLTIKNWTNIWTIPPVKKSKKHPIDHPTPFPLLIPLRCIQSVCTSADSLVFDPYSGSGTVGVAATLLGHRFIGVDCSLKYNQVALGRISSNLPENKKLILNIENKICPNCHLNLTSMEETKNSPPPSDDPVMEVTLPPTQNMDTEEEKTTQAEPKIEVKLEKVDTPVQQVEEIKEVPTEEPPKKKKKMSEKQLEALKKGRANRWKKAKKEETQTQTSMEVVKEEPVPKESPKKKSKKEKYYKRKTSVPTPPESSESSSDAYSSDEEQEYQNTSSAKDRVDQYLANLLQKARENQVRHSVAVSFL
mmetsp:Transcript_8727/g.11506  ORF Transcript_8727/g.11506 Transcript_8727/m.11506 type:complete len:449 (-) Transcript_8727:4013-5359(-)